MNRYSTGKFTGQFKATIGADFLTKDVVIQDSLGYSQIVTLQIWDTAGQERFQSLGVAFYRGSDAAILVYDVTDPASLDHLERWQREFLDRIPPVPNGPPFPFLVVGNKIDKERRVPQTAALEWCQKASFFTGGQQPLPHLETSAKTAAQVQDAFTEIARAALTYEEFKRRSQPQLFVPPSNVDLRRPEREQDPCC